MTRDTSLIVGELVARLSDETNTEPAAGFPSDPFAANQPGLYSWWVDAEGMDELSAPFSIRLPPLIYAGQAGATSTRSGMTRAATLRSRIGGNHLNGNVGSSTFRKTLTSVLFEPLDLRLTAPGVLEGASNRNVSAWMRSHLRLTIAPHPDRTTLAVVEEAVLERLDPPLNLMGMSPSPVRTRLRELRAALSVRRSENSEGNLNAGATRSELPQRGTLSAIPNPSSSTAVTRLTLHMAMVEVLRGQGWLSFNDVAERIARRDLYRRRDGRLAAGSQLRRRATQSGGQYVHLFDVDLGRIRLRD